MCSPTNCMRFDTAAHVAWTLPTAKVSKPVVSSFGGNITPLSRRHFLSLLALPLLLPTPANSAPKGKAKSKAQFENVCRFCRGSGEQTCGVCEGSGLVQMGEDYTARCPYCRGSRKITCQGCIGLGLGDVRGILRDGMMLVGNHSLNSFLEWERVFGTRSGNV